MVRGPGSRVNFKNSTPLNSSSVVSNDSVEFGTRASNVGAPTTRASNVSSRSGMQTIAEQCPECEKTQRLLIEKEKEVDQLKAELRFFRNRNKSNF